MSITVTPEDQFIITAPDNAEVNTSGQVVMDLSLAGLGGAALADVDLKSDVHMLGPVRVSLISTANGTTYSFCPMFDGVLVGAAMVLDGAETTDLAGVTISISNTGVTLSEALRQTGGTSAGIAKTVTTTGGPWTFTATEVITITTVATNAAATFGGITLGATRS